MMRNDVQATTYSRIVMLVFVTLAASLGLLMAGYWFLSLEPRLTADAAARAAALAQAQSGALSRVLSSEHGKSMAADLIRTMDGILLVRDPSTGVPMVHRIDVSVDYQVLAVPERSLDVTRGQAVCNGCFVDEIPLYHQQTLALVGIARFHSGREFLDNLTADVRDKLLWGGSAMVLLIWLAWVGTNRLLRRLHWSETNLRGVFEAAPFPMVLQQREEDRPVRVNHSATEYLGLAADEAGRYNGAAWQCLRQAMPKQGLADPTEIEFTDVDDQSRWVLASTRQVSYDGSPANLISLADISLLKQAQQALLRAKEDAESATRAKSAFVATISHEIRTPLNAILGMAHLLSAEALSADQRRFVASIQEAGDALLAQVNGILDFSQIEAGRLELIEEEFDLRALVDSVLSIFNVKARQKGLRFESRLMQDVGCRYVGDSHRIQQVLINLLGNAIKFTDRGWVRLEVRIKPLDEERDHVRFQVADSGIGIHPTQLAGLFDEFTQADGSVSRRHGGTGLGLAISQRLGARMGGELTARSAPGEGSTFNLRLPLRRGAPIGHETAAKAAEASSSDVAPMDILVVDDERLNRIFVNELLTRDGHRVAMAENGSQALERLRTRPFDLVLMDIRMPVMDGLEASRRIRDLPDRAQADTPLVALTADVTPETLKACAAAGLDEVLSKPLSPDVLRKTLRAFRDNVMELEGGGQIEESRGVES